MFAKNQGFKTILDAFEINSNVFEFQSVRSGLPNAESDFLGLRRHVLLDFDFDVRARQPIRSPELRPVCFGLEIIIFKQIFIGINNFDRLQ